MNARTLCVAVLLLAGCGDGTDADAGVGMDAATLADAGDTDAGDVDAGAGSDAGPGTDAGATDAGPGSDAGDVDAGPACEGMTEGFCADGALGCLCCPAGGPTQNCLCTTACTDDAECTDPARPHCNQPRMGMGGGSGICTPMMFTCAWGAVCASPDTAIATPSGERPIAELEVGDLVYTMHEGALVARPLIQITRTPVVDHAVVRAVLESGRTLFISGPHPTADGRRFWDLRPGDDLDGTRVIEVQTVAYEHPFTHDILPDSDTGTYVAGGVLIGSTLTP
ncbi:MAG: Hint domain-containing protein [Sandaracinaceae bacterium]|nr:Hint domain-containing protein [Sandaracinaceae bacterium]